MITHINHHKIIPERTKIMAARTARKPARKSASKSKSDRQSVYEIVTDKIVSQLEAGTVPWRKPWASAGLPLRMNANTKKGDTPYRGVNVFLLFMAGAAGGYASPYWGTYDHIAERSGMTKVPDTSRKGFHWESPDGSPRGVRKGETGTLIVWWSTWKRTETDPATGEDTKHFGAKLRHYTVFNAEQAHAEHMPARFLVTEKSAPGADNRPIEEAEAIVRRYLADHGPELVHDDPSRACYWPVDDKINVPAITQFEDVNEYYSTGFHELGHSTGHEDRLNRHDLGAGCIFGSPDYSREELIAEMTCAFLCALSGVNTPEVTSNSAAYLASWIRKLRGDAKLVVAAAAAAQKAVDAIMGVSWDTDEIEPSTAETETTKAGKPELVAA
jgi:antirestriction protein ArdC